MYYKLKQMTESDYVNESLKPVSVADIKVVNKGSILKERESLGLAGSETFGYSKSKKARDIYFDYMRSYISLCKPVINPIYFSNTIKILIYKLCGITKSEMDNIMNYNVVFDLTIGEPAIVSEVNASHDILYGAEYLYYLIENKDFHAYTAKHISNLLYDKFCTKTEDNPFFVEYLPSEGNIFFDYKLNIKKLPHKYPDLTIYDAKEYIIQSQFLKPTSDTLLTVLLRTKPDNFKSIIMSKIRIVPQNNRPSQGRRIDPLDTFYSNIINAHNIVNITDLQNPVAVARNMRVLQQSVNTLIYKATSVEDLKKNRRSVFQLLSGKFGYVRSSFSKTQDFSGRSVIIADPTLKIDEISIPRMMLGTVLKYHTDYKHSESNENIVTIDEVIKNIPCAFNRAPTLHKLSYLAFKIVPSDKLAIGLNPLIQAGFNADFDGDQMAIKIPLSNAAIDELKTLLHSEYNKYKPANGSITLVPSQELIYGLWILSKAFEDEDENQEPVTFSNYSDLCKAFENQDIKVYERVSFNGITTVAGDFLIYYIFNCICPNETFQETLNKRKKNSPKEYIKKCIITGKSIDDFMTVLTFCPTEKEFIERAHRLVQLAYISAAIYNPPIPVLVNLENKSITEPFSKFEDEMEAQRVFYQDGLDTKDFYYDNYTTEFNKVAESVSKKLREDIGYDNGLVQIVECGARGNDSNLQQMFSYKGRISKSATEVFPTVIKSSFVSQLSSLEHFVCAYGTRKSVVDKVRKPQDTGYLTRKMIHASADAVIVSDDCGTTEGIPIKISDLQAFCKPRGNSDKEIRNMFASILAGRYEAGTNKYITMEEANELADSANENTITYIRSVFTCKDKYCAKCYGVDLSTRRRSIKGLPIGVICAQSIGEPATQLTMKSFHGGGIATKKDIGNDFDNIAYILDYAPNIGVVNKDPSQYDFVAPFSCTITYDKDLNKAILTSKSNKNKTITFPIDSSIALKEEAQAGEGICAVQGNLSLSDIIKYSSLIKAQMYMAYYIFTIYYTQAEVNLKHIETLVSELTRYIVIDIKDYEGRYKIGSILDQREYRDIPKDKVICIPKIFGCISAALSGEDFLAAATMERVEEIFTRSIIYKRTDNMTKMFSRMLAGFPPLSGNMYENFLEEHKTVMKEKPLY